MSTEEGNRVIAELKSIGYAILSDGRVLGKAGVVLKLHKGTSGYMQVNCYKNGKLHKTFLVHRLVASAFIPNPENFPEVNHLDGDKSNNRFTNLKWVTRSENIKHGIDTGLIKKSMVGRVGKKHWRSIPLIMYDFSGNMTEFESAGEAAKETGFNRKAIFDAISGKLKTYKGYKWRYKL